ncbi:MAG: 1,6-anhydro-N-acetylmuramyl-L-alanine amidase AmpD [Candidatus Competibacterales bacterium]
MQSRDLALTVGDQGAWFAAATRRPSPNWDSRPQGVAVDLVVVHGISLPPRHFGGPWIDALFTNQLDTAAHPAFAGLKGLRVSAHLLIRRSGTLVQYVPLDGRAWHAGASCFQGRPACNDFSIGVELEGSDAIAYQSIQYHALAAVIRTLQGRYPAIGDGRIVGHQHIAPGRKTDPGPAFDWGLLHRLLRRAALREIASSA